MSKKNPYKSDTDAIIGQTLEGIITSWNPGAEKLFGHTAAEAIGQPILMLIPPERADEKPRILARIAHGGRVRHFETIRLRKDGTRLHVSVTFSPVKDITGKIIGASKVARDITERKQAEAALRSSEPRYRRLFEAAKDGVLILDGQTGQITDANPYILDVLGITHAGVLGQELWEIGVFGDAAANRAAVAVLQDGGYVRYDDLPLESQTGQVRQVEVVANLYEENGQRVIQCNIRDVTERKQASQYARSLIEASLDPLVTISAEGKITDVNEGSIKVTGVVREKLIGTDFSDYFTEPKKAREGYQQVFAKGFVTDYPLTIRHQDGRLTDVLYNASVYKDVSGNVLGVFAAARDITARKLAEETIAQQLRELDALYATAPTGLFELDAELRYVRVNGWMATINGRSVEAHIGRTMSEVLNPEMAGYIEPLFRQVLQTGEPILELEVHGTTAASVEARDWLVSCYPVRGEGGEVVGLHGVAVDITASKQASEYARSLLEASLDPLVTISAEGKITDVNEGSIKVTGVVREKLIGTDFSDYFTEPEKAREGYQQVFAKGFVTDYPLTIRHQDGRLTDVLYNASVYRDMSGNVLGVFAAARDITDRKQAEEKLRESVVETNRARDYAEATLRTAPIPLLVLRADLRVNTANEAFYKNFQVAPAETEGALIYDLGNHQWNIPKLRELLEEILPKNNFFNDFEITHEFETIGRRTMLLNARRMENEAGQPLQIVLAIEDITDRKQAEEALRVAMVEVERASRAKDDFLAALSHELRTPLTPVLMTATALADDSTLPAHVREQIAMMRRNIELEARLIDDLLDLTRISRGKLQIEPLNADIHQLIEHTAEIVRSDALGKRVRTVFKLKAERHHAMVDPTRLQQVLWNLIHNAIKFTPTTGTITVSTRNDAAGGIVINVADNGIGIRAEALSQIFNAFDQADTTGEHRYGGLGLGLAISSAIVTAHGGEIKVESAGLGHGADFTVTLGSVPASTTTSQRNARAAQPARALSLLVVEDHETTRTVLKRLLTRSGYQVITATTVHDALAAYKSSRFDAVISDLGLPDGSGIDMMVQIQSIRPVPAIALSGYGMEEDLQRSKAAGFFAHLVKPVKVDQLKQLLTQLPDHAGHHDNA